MTRSPVPLDLFTVADRLEAELLRAASTDEWYTGVEIHLLAYRSLLENHITSCRADDMFHDLIEIEPRVVPLVSRIRVECDKLDELAAFALAAVHSPSRSAGETAARLTDLLRLTNRHRSHNIDLVHEAYAVDIGGTG